MLYILVVTTIISFSTIKLLSKSLHFNDMNKAISFLIIVTMIVSVMGMISADTTVVAGKIYNSDYTQTIEGAKVIVTCGETTASAVNSAEDGSYKVQYESVCDAGDTLIVYAEKDGLTGSKTAKLQTSTECTDSDNCLIQIYSDLDIAVVNVPLVPEFGAMVAGLTVLGALGVFFVVRKR